jgi:hypothetical protein
MLYTTNEDMFLNEKGFVYYINIDNETDSGVFKEKVTAADGAYLDG